MATFFPSATAEGLDCQLVPPRAPFFELNVDEAVFASQKAAVMGAVIYDEKGHLIAALSKKIDAPLGALEAEAKALESSLHFTLEMGIYDLVIESDSWILYNALSDQSPSPSLVAHVVYGLKSPLHDFRHVKICPICRQGNKSAHLLAKYAFDINDFFVWIEESTYILEQVLLHDVFSTFHTE